MKYTMFHPTDQSKLWGHVAAQDCAYCGAIGPVQVAHSNQARDGKGMSVKSYPWRVAALCPACHYALDQGKELTKIDRRDMWEAAHRQTIGRLFEEGKVRPV